MTCDQAPQSVTPSKNSREVEIRQYRREDHAAVTKIFSEGVLLMDEDSEFRHLWERFLRRELANDLANIEASHMAQGGNFWVATVSNPASAAGGAHEANKVVGMAGLMHKAEGVGEVRRVFVDPSCHRMGIGRKLMVALEEWARENSYRHLFLTTKAKSSRNLAFYSSLGYTQQKEPLIYFEESSHFEIVKFCKDL